MRYGTIGSCQFCSCHFRDCKALLVTSLTRVSGAIASVQTFTFISSERVSEIVDDDDFRKRILSYIVALLSAFEYPTRLLYCLSSVFVDVLLSFSRLTHHEGGIELRCSQIVLTMWLKCCILLLHTTTANKKLSCRKETARCVVSFNISISHFGENLNATTELAVPTSIQCSVITMLSFQDMITVGQQTTHRPTSPTNAYMTLETGQQ